MDKPLLTIAIPTFNRAAYLALSLDRIGAELASIPAGLVELIVSDNASTDATPDVVAAAQARGLALRVLRNATNIGPNANSQQCFQAAQGRYVLILGDDDLPTRGGLQRLIALLKDGDYGVLCLRPYGYDEHPDREHPGGTPRIARYQDPGAFLARCGALVTFISACVINKALVKDDVLDSYAGTNLVQMNWVLSAALQAKVNLFVIDYLVACKRNNSGGYDFAAVFVDEFGMILDQFTTHGLSIAGKTAIEKTMILSFYPAPLLRQRFADDPRLADTRRSFEARYGTNRLYRFFLRPVLSAPRSLAILWGGGAMALGRIWNGDLRRGFAFVRHRLQAILTH
jgi:abequosyltransferase